MSYSIHSLALGVAPAAKARRSFTAVAFALVARSAVAVLLSYLLARRPFAAPGLAIAEPPVLVAHEPRSFAALA